MKRSIIATLRPVLLWLMVWMLLAGVMTGPLLLPAAAETAVTPLTPKDLVYEDGNIILHKHGLRTGPDEWKVTVRATIGEVPVEKRKMEVVFLLDISRSMNNNAHTHTLECYEIICGKTAHEHVDECYDMENPLCGKTEHTHTSECFDGSCTQTEHTHSEVGGSCYTICTKKITKTIGRGGNTKRTLIARR